MENLKLSIGQFLVEAMAVTTIIALMALIVSTLLIRLVGWLRTRNEFPGAKQRSRASPQLLSRVDK